MWSARCLSAYPHLSTFECMIQSLRKLACISWHLRPSHRRNSFHQSVCTCSPLSLLGNGSVNMFPQQQKNYCPFRFQGQSVGLRVANFSTCTNEAVVSRLSKPSDSKTWSWVSCDSQLRILVLVGVSSNLLDWAGVDRTVYPFIVARQRLLNTLPRQRRIVGGVVFYEIRVISKESRQAITSYRIFLLSNRYRVQGGRSLKLTTSSSSAELKNVCLSTDTTLPSSAFGTTEMRHTSWHV
jgi:hypothetical protein